MKQLVLGPGFFLLLLGPTSAVQATAPIPFSTLSPEDRAALEDVVRRPILSRVIKGFTFLSRKEVYEYLLDHPDFATGLARTLGLSKYRIQREPGGYQARDFRDYGGTEGRGMEGHFKTVYADPAKRVFFVWGTYKKLLFTIRARAVLVLEYHHRVRGGESYGHSTLSSYVMIDHPLFKLVARLLSPILGRAMDRSMKKTLRLAAKISEAAYRDPAAFAKKLEGSPELPRKELAEFRRALCPGCY
ncbi:MAG: hypothetical protein ACE5JN_11325 [Candidatus Methylomirabilia bacterium]